jgi:hypothetical protein
MLSVAVHRSLFVLRSIIMSDWQLLLLLLL